MRTVRFPFEGVTYHLLLNGEALFTLYERYGSEGSLTDHIQGMGQAAFAATCVFLAVLGTQGELWRRYQGYDSGPIPTEELFRLGLSPLEVPLARAAITQAIRAGFQREAAAEGREVDVGLLELEKKTAAASPEGST